MQCRHDPSALEIKTINDFDKLSYGDIFHFTCISCNKQQYVKGNKCKNRLIKRYSTFLCENCFRESKRVSFYTRVSTDPSVFKLLCNRIMQNFFKNNIVELRYIINIPNVRDFKYIISEYGDVFTYDSSFNITKLKFHKHNGYNNVSLSSGLSGSKRLTTVFVHRLVCTLWNGNPPDEIDDPVVDHIDGNRGNNHYSNLRWLSRGVNASIALHRTGIGTDMAEVIAKMIVSGKSNVEIQRETGISNQKIKNLKQGISYKSTCAKYNLRRYVRKMTDRLPEEIVKEACFRLFVLHQDKYKVSEITNIPINTLDHIIYDNTYKREKYAAMEKDFKINLIKQLEKEIRAAQDLYYNTDQVMMSDAEFDKKFDMLTELDPTNPILHTIGEDSGSAFAKAPHVMHMFSQQKCKEPDEFLDWVKKHPEDEYLVEYKLDGSSLELQYVNGIFTRAVTRGKDGTIGDDVTANIVTSDVPREIPNKNFTGGFRGEVLLYHDDFAKYFTDKANCRNAANGILKRKEGTNKEFLHVICYDCQWLNYSHVFETELEKLAFMEENGFNVVPYFWFNDPNEIIKFRDKLGSERFTALNYDIDGLVIKCNGTDKEDVKRDRPERQIAFKFVLDEQVSPLIGVEWSVAGKTRTPVGIVEPIRLCGTTVQRANLCNLDLIKKLGIKIGSKVVMVKRGEIIPKIVRVAETPADATDIQIPTVCETCGQPLTITNTDIFCSNPNCPNTICHRIETWCKVFKVYGMGEANIKSLFYEGVITDIVDFYNSNEVDDGIIRVMGEANGSKVLPRLKAIAKQPQLLSSILEGFDMDFVGEATSKLLTKELSYDWEEFKKKLNYANVAAIPGLGDKSALNIVDSIKANIDKLDELIKYFKLDVPVATGTKLAGMNFCVTGEVHKFTNRKELEMFIEMNGGKTQSGVSKKTNYLICNEASESGKYVTATKLGVPIITEDEFIERFSK